MQPVVLRGLTGGAAEAVSAEEFRVRAEAVRDRVRAGALAGLIVYGDASDYADLCYLSGYIPMLRWAMVLVPSEGEPTLFVAIPPRNIGHARTLSCLSDVRPIGEFAAALKSLGGQGPVGLVGSARVRASIYRRWSAAATIEAVDERLPVISGPPSKRELELLRIADGVTQRVAGVAEQNFRDGAPAAEALRLGLRVAREVGAHDVRALISPNGGRVLHPFPGGTEPTASPLLFHLALELDGYWGETFRFASTFEFGDERRTQLSAEVLARLEATAGRLHVGMPYREVAAAMDPGDERHDLVAGARAIARLGLGRVDLGDDDGGVTPGIYALRAGAVRDGMGVLLSRTVEVAA